jgi:hypothetical protein
MEFPNGASAGVIRYVGGVGYFQSSLLPLPAGKQWVRIDPRDLGISTSRMPAIGSGDPTEGLHFLGSIVGNPVEMSHEIAGGTVTTRYSVTLNLSGFFDKFAQTEGSLSPIVGTGLQKLREQIDLAHFPAEAWLDSDGRVRRLNLVLSFQGPDLTFEAKESTSFSDFGAPVQVNEPGVSETVPFSAAKDLLASASTG